MPDFGRDGCCTELQNAIYNRDLPLVRQLLDEGHAVNGVNVDTRSESLYGPPLFVACSYFPDAIDLLLARGADLNGVYTDERTTALHVCAYSGNATTASIIMRLSPTQLQAVNRHGDTPEQTAAYYGNSSVEALLRDGAAQMESPPPQQPPTSLATSRFLANYSQPESRPDHLYQLEAAVHNLIRTHAQGAGIDRSEADEFFRTLRTNALSAAIQGDGGGADEILRPEQLMYIAVRLWTSAETLHGREYCSLLNQVLREDRADAISHAAIITHAINTFCVMRRGGTPVQWPSDHILYRGGAMPRCFQSFFAVGQTYRAPMFVATSANQNISVHTYLMRLPPATAAQSPPFQEPVLWRFHLDGALPEARRCVHVNFLDRTDGTVHGEDEFLFAPYSVFTVRHVEWQSQPTVNGLVLQPHYIDVDVASDNLRQPLDLPLAPWC